MIFTIHFGVSLFLETPISYWKRGYSIILCYFTRGVLENCKCQCKQCGIPGLRSGNLCLIGWRLQIAFHSSWNSTLKKRNQSGFWKTSAIPHENLDYNKKRNDRNTWNEALFNGSVPPIDQCNRSDWTQTISIWLKDNWILSQGHLWNWSDGISKLFIRKYIHHSINTAKERDAKVTKIDHEDHASIESKSFHCYMRSAWANFQWINLKMRRQIAGTY